MKIRTQLIICIIVFIVALAVVSGLVISSTQRTDQLGKQQELVKNIELRTGELGYISSDYVLSPNSIQIDRWESTYSSIANYISSLAPVTPDQHAAVDSMTADQQRLKLVFDDIVAATGNQSGSQLLVNYPASVQVSWSRLAIQQQNLLYDVNRLSRALTAEEDQLKTIFTALVIILVIGLFAFVSTILFLFYRRTLNSIEDLQKGARIIGSGDLNYIIPEKGDDEISDLSRAFNQMITNLKGVTASKVELEQEVTDRKKVEEELGERNEELNAMNEELTATQEELQQNVDELMKAESELRLISQYLENLITYANAPIVVWDKDFRITRFNLAFERLAGKQAKNIIGQPLEILFPKESTRKAMDIIRETSRGERLDVVEIPILQQNGKVRTVLWNTATLYEADGKTILSVIAQGQDITERRRAEMELMKKNEDLNSINEELTAAQEELLAANEELIVRERELRVNELSLKEALAEKDILLSEIHHRVKNNLAAFISLLSLGGSYEETPEGLNLKKDLQNRARSMALIHETLYRTKNFSNVDMEVYLTTLVNQIAGSYFSRRPIRTIVYAKGIFLDIARATPCGLIINELITNSFKYAFPESFNCKEIRGDTCTIRVSLEKENSDYTLSVCDNGIGLPPGLDPQNTQSLGLKLVNFLARHQLRAKIEVNSSNGTVFLIRFKDRE